MHVYTFGSVLKQLRKEKHISQGDMCSGLCNVAMASRIERGERVPSRKLIEALFSRIGERAPMSQIPMTKADFIMRNLEFEMSSMVTYANFEIKDKLEKYKTLKKNLTNLELQCYERYKCLYENRNKDHNDYALEQLIATLRRTVPEYELNSLFPHKFLTQTEFLLLNNISRLQYALGQKNEAMQLMTFLKKYYESSFINKRLAAQNLSLVLFNLANWYGLAGQSKESLELSEWGMKLCAKFGLLADFPYHIFNKAYSYAQSDKKEDSLPIFSDSFCLLDAIGKHDDVLYAVPIINTQFGLNFSTE